MILVGTRTLINASGNGHLPTKSHGVNCISVWFMIDVSHLISIVKNDFSHNRNDILHLEAHMISDHDVSPYIVEIEL